MLFEQLNYNICFEIAALLLLIVLLLCVKKTSRIKIPVYRMFFILVWLHIVTCVLDISTTFLLSIIEQLPIWLIYTFNTLYYLATNATAPIFVIYVLLTLNITFGEHKCLYFAALLPSVLSLAAIILNPLTNCIFYFDAELNYLHGPLFYALFGVAFYCCLFGSLCIWRRKRSLGKSKRYAIYSFTVMMILSVVLQLMMPQMLLQLFGAAISLLTVSLTLQNPEDIFDISTGVYTRTAFFDRVNLNYGTKTPFYLLNIYFDGCSSLDKTFGYTQNEEFEKKIGTFLYSAVRNTWVSKISDGCFSLEVEGRTIGDIESIISRICQRFDQPWRVGEISITVPVKVFCIYSPGDAATFTELMEQLEQYRPADHRGVVYARNMKYKSFERKTQILEIVRRAIANDGVVMYYQPIYSSEKKKINSAEALIRIYDEKLGFIPPDEFIPLAEKEGLILSLGQIVFDKVCRFISSNDMDKLGLEYIEINLSVIQCMQKQLADKLVEIISRYGIPVRYINLEITETAAANYPEILESNMTKLRERGISFSLDDYGTGYSNITYTYKLPFSYIKIDKCILWSALENKKAFITLKHTFAMIKQMRMKIIMEGVETVEQVRELARLDCDYMQGYFFSRPLPEASFVKYVSEFRNPDAIFSDIGVGKFASIK